MLSFEAFTLYILFFILAPIIGAITILFLFIFEKRIDLLKTKAKQIELESDLQKAQYIQLSQQIQPHFLFNTLNVILSLARLKRNDELIRALEVLSLFLKHTYNTNEPLIPIIKEIQYTEYYLEIQKLRFGSRLTVNIHYHPEVANAYIPSFILQTLVENAFKHGLERKLGQAKLDIHIYQNEDQVYLLVIDNGESNRITNKSTTGSGHGLENIRKRLKLHFDKTAKLSIHLKEEIGTEVKVTWPLIKHLEEVSE